MFFYGFFYKKSKQIFKKNTLIQILIFYFMNFNHHQSHLARNYRRLDSSDEKLLFQLKKVKYPVLAIEPAQRLQNKLSQFSKNEKLYNQMKDKLMKENELNTYRKIRGDGNCFFRALAYSILSGAKNLSNVEETFYYLNDIKLTSCHEKSIPKEFRPYYKEDLLKLLLKQNWGFDVNNYKNLYKMSNKRILSRLFRKYPYLDFIVILYFRALCLKGLQKHKSELKEFMKGTQEEEIKTYGQESEGVILDICSRYLKISIDVYEVRSSQIKHYSYKKANYLSFSGPFNQVSLLYYENHYDIIEKLPEKELLQQKYDSKIQQEEYYSTINQQMVSGCCIQCGKQTKIYEDNSLCQDCFHMSRNQLINTVKSGKFVRGTCRQCYRRDVKVQEMIELCERCIQKQQLAQQSKVEEKIKKIDLKQKQSYFQPQQQQIDYCLQCDRRQVIDPETKLCAHCKSMQKLVLKRQEERRKQQCLNCRQQLDSEYHQLKCVKKLTEARIGMGKMPYEQKKCKDCGESRFIEELNDGVCRKCQRKARQLRDKIRAQNQNPKGPIITLGQRVFQETEKCKRCKRPTYIYSYENGLCTLCKYQKSNQYRFL